MAFPPFEVAANLAQQSSNGNYHLYMYVDPDAKARGDKLAHDHKFKEFLLERCIAAIFGTDASSQPELHRSKEPDQLR